MPVALTSVLQSLAVPHCFQAPWNSKSLALGMLQLTNSSYLDLPEPSCEVMPGHVTVISELPNGEQALQKLESIRCFFCICVLEPLQYKRTHWAKAYMWYVRTLDDQDVILLMADREELAIDLANVKATLQELINSYRLGEAMTVDGIMSTIMDLQEAIDNEWDYSLDVKRKTCMPAL